MSCEPSVNSACCLFCLRWATDLGIALVLLVQATLISTLILVGILTQVGLGILLRGLIVALVCRLILVLSLVLAHLAELGGIQIVLQVAFRNRRIGLLCGGELGDARAWAIAANLPFG